jgi:hypothetical protein
VHLGCAGSESWRSPEWARAKWQEECVGQQRSHMDLGCRVQTALLQPVIPCAYEHRSSSPTPELLPLSPAILALMSDALCSPLLSVLRTSSFFACVSYVRTAWRGAEERVKTLLRWARARRVDLVVYVGWRKHAPSVKGRLLACVRKRAQRCCRFGMRSHTMEFVELPLAAHALALR